MWQLFISFARIGAFGVGGGSSMIPLLRIEAVKTNGWMNDEEFMELYAIANSLPSPISTNLAGQFVWWRAGMVASFSD